MGLRFGLDGEDFRFNPSMVGRRNLTVLSLVITPVFHGIRLHSAREYRGRLCDWPNNLLITYTVYRVVTC